MNSFYDGTFDRECEECGETVPADEDLWLHKDKDEINVGWDCCKERLEAEGWVNPNDDSLEGWVPDGSHILTKPKTVTEKLSEALRELVSYEVDRIIDENNDWFMELLNKQIEACLKEAFVPVLRESDFAFDCEECGRFVEAGYDILIDDEIRIGSCCMRHDRNWTSAGSIIGPLLVRWWEKKEETV